jgi:hypothetical protein
MTTKHTENLDELYGVMVDKEKNTYFNSDENTFGIALWHSYDLQDTLEEAKELLKKALDCGYEKAKIVKLNFIVEVEEI